MIRKNLVATTIVACLFGGVVLATADGESRLPRHQVGELQSQKLGLLTELRERYQFGYSRDLRFLVKLIDTDHEILILKLELAESSDQRIGLCEEIVQNRRKLIEAVDANMRMGKAAETEILAAKVKLVDSQILLAREQASIR